MSAVLVGLLAGCATQRVEPQPLPKSKSYRMDDKALKQLSGLVVRLDLDLCIPYAPLSWGGTLESVEFRKLIDREFRNFLKDNEFQSARDGLKEHVVLRVTPGSTTITGNSHTFSDDTVTADFTFAVELTPPLGKEGGLSFWREYDGLAESPDPDKQLIPECVYTAIMDTVSQFKEELEKNQSALGFLEQLIIEAGARKAPFELSGWHPKSFADENGFQASVRCTLLNVMMDKAEALSWAKEQIRLQCKAQFGTDDFKVFYTEQAFDEKGAAWNIILYACRASEVADGMAFFHEKGERNGMGERGLCIVDRGNSKGNVKDTLRDVRVRLVKDFRDIPNYKGVCVEKPRNASEGVVLVPYSISFKKNQ